MGGETATDSSWFSNFWKTSKKGLVFSEPEKAVIGILSFEVVRLMSELVNLWQCLGDRQIIKVREEIVNSVGLQKLVSEDEGHLMDLALAEMIETLRYVGKSAAVLGKRCADPTYHHLDEIFVGRSVVIDPNWCRWEYRLKKMERRIKKMERFIAATLLLHQELQVLKELEQTLNRRQAGADFGQVSLFEFRQRVVGQRLEVKNLQEMSPWVRSYDYIVRLLCRSIITIMGRLQNVFGLNENEETEGIADSAKATRNCLVRSNSISSLMLSSVHPSENYLSRLYSGPLGRSFSTLGLVTERSRSHFKKSMIDNQSENPYGKLPRLKGRRFGSFKECMSGGDSPIVQSCMPSSSESFKLNGECQDCNGNQAVTNTLPVPRCSSVAAKISLFSSKHKSLDAPPCTLGYAALALHYANVIILIEKLGVAPHLISDYARDDLYQMLPMAVRTILREKLKVFRRNLASSGYDAALAAEWSVALSRILSWLSPLAHNTIRWHSDRKFDKQPTTSGTHVLLVQTLYFANQATTEAAVTELLLGLNYLARFGQELSEKQQSLVECSCSRASNDFPFCVDSFAQHNQSHFAADLSLMSVND